MTALVALAATAAGAVQTQVMVQGYLTNSSGTPYTTPQTAEFRVYQGGNATTAGTGVLYYDETASVNPSGSGVFNYALGSGSPSVPFLVVGGGATVPNVLSPTTFDTTQPVYLEISVGGFALLPRLQLLGTPYASLATTAENLKPTSALVTNSLVASYVVVNTTGTNQYSLTTSTGIKVLAGMVEAPAFNGTYYGDGSKLSGVGAASVGAGNVAPGVLGNGVQLLAGSIVNGPIAAGILPSSVPFTTISNTFGPAQAFPGGLTATTGTFSTLAAAAAALTGTGQYSLTTSSGIKVLGGSVDALAFNGTYYGDGSKLSGVGAASVGAANVAAGLLGAGVQLPAGSLVNGPIAAGILPSSVPFTTTANIFGPTQAFPGGLSASTGTFTASGSAQYSLITSSGIKVLAGSVDAPAFNGTHYGDGSNLTGVGAASVAAGAVVAGTLGAGVQLQAGSLINGPIAAGILPSSVPFTTVSNTFVPPQAFPGGLSAGSLDVTPAGNALERIGGVYSGPTSGYSGIGQETSRHQLSFRSWSNVVPDTLGAKIAAVNKTAYPSAPWYLAQTTELHFSILKAGALTADDTFDEVQLTPAGLNAVDGLTTPKGVTAASGTFTAIGNAQYSLSTSSGIKVLAGSVDAPAFNGTYYGDGSKLAGVTATSVAAGSVQAGQLGSGVQLQAGSLVNGPVAAGILPSSVPFTTVPNVFTPPQAFPGGLTASSGTFLNGVTAASGTFSATGQYSLSTSSGIKVLAGSVDAPTFNGTYYGDGSKLSGISPGTPVGTIVLFAGTSEPSGWVECDGRSLGQSGTAVASWGNYSTAALFGAIGTVWGSAGAGVYNLPDFRGIVPRGYNHGKTGSWSDPDAGSRVAQYASGATGDAIGTYQLDELKSHTHSLSFTASGADSNSGGPNYNTTGANQPTSATGGNETRPKNASVLYIVRVQ